MMIQRENLEEELLLIKNTNSTGIFSKNTSNFTYIHYDFFT